MTSHDLTCHSLSASATTIVFNSMMIHFYDKPDQVVQYFDLLKSDGRQPDATSYDCLIKAYIKKGLEVMLEKTLAKVVEYFTALQRGEYVMELLRRLAPKVPFTDVRTYTSIIKSLLQCGYADEAWTLIQEGAKKSFIPYIHIWGALMAVMKRQNADTALEVYSKVRELNLKLDVQFYLTLIEVYASKSMPDKMLEVYDTLTSEGHNLPDELITKFFDGLTSTSPVHAVQFLKEMSQLKKANIPSRESYLLLVEQLRTNQLKEIDLVISSARAKYDNKFAARLSAKLVGAHTAARDWVHALSVIDSMLSHGVVPRPKTVSSVVLCMVQHGKSAQARQTVEALIKQGVPEIENVYTNVCASYNKSIKP